MWLWVQFRITPRCSPASNSRLMAFNILLVKPLPYLLEATNPTLQYKETLPAHNKPVNILSSFRRIFVRKIILIEAAVLDRKRWSGGHLEDELHHVRVQKVSCCLSQWDAVLPSPYYPTAQPTARWLSMALLSITNVNKAMPPLRATLACMRSALGRAGPLQPNVQVCILQDIIL